MFTSESVIGHDESYAVVSLTGDVDLTVRQEILDVYAGAIAPMAVPHLVVDVSGVTFMDSTGLSTLAPAVNEVEARGGTVTVVGANDRIKRLFHIAQLDSVVTMRPDDS